MKAAIISLGSLSSKWIFEEMKKCFDTVDFLDLKKCETVIDPKAPQILYDGELLGNYDCVYVRGSYKYAKLMAAISSVLEINGTYIPLKSSIFTVAHDKLLTHLDLQKHGVPMPQTYVVSDINTGKRLLARVKYPIVMKFPEGTHGKGVMFGESYASASAILDALTALRQPFLLQEFIETNECEDYRIIVIGDEVAASMKRTAAHGEQRSNFHLGGTCAPIELSDGFRRVAVAAAKAVDADILAVDVINGIKGPMVVEINSSPGLQGITAATSVNVAEKIAKFLADMTQQHLKAKSAKELDRIAPKGSKHLTTNIKVRGGKIILPEFVADLTSFTEDEELMFEMDKGKLTIERFN
jgi:ribosomal protein S6--L-glutamate ligase